MKKYSGHLPTLMALHRCRLYAQVYSLSDISTRDGKKVQKSSIMDLDSLHSRGSNLIWPRQQVTQNDRRIWRDCLTELFGAGSLLSAPLGPWLVPSHKPWKCFYSPSTGDYLVQSGTSWNVFHPNSAITLRQQPHKLSHAVHTLPFPAYPATVDVSRSDSDFWYFEGWAHPPSPPPSLSFTDYLAVCESN